MLSHLEWFDENEKYEIVVIFFYLHILHHLFNLQYTYHTYFHIAQSHIIRKNI